MKIKNIVAYGSLALSAAALIITVHHQKYNEARFEQQQNTIESLENEVGVQKDEITDLKNKNLQLQEQLENITIEDMLDNLIEELKKEAEKINIFFVYHKEEETLSITYENKEVNTDYKLSDQFYSRLNQLMVFGNIRELSLHNLGDEIDFSRVDMPSVKDISFYQCNENLDCSSFTQEYHSIHLYSTPTIATMKILKNIDCSKAEVGLYKIGEPLFDYDKKIPNMDIGLLARFLIEDNICMKKLSVQQWSYYMDETNSLTDQEINLLSQVNTEILSISTSGNLNPINLNLELNPNIQELYLELPESVYSWVSGIIPRELHEIRISSNNPYVTITFHYGTITENTHFSLPTSSTVKFKELVYDDITPFYNLENARMVVYERSDIWQTDYDEKTCIVYIAELDTIDDFTSRLLDYPNNSNKVYTME